MLETLLGFQRLAQWHVIQLVQPVFSRSLLGQGRQRLATPQGEKP